jgi:glycosyltransferase involved in cell wall biosynthesis
MEAVVVTHNSQAPLSAMLDSAATRAAFDRILVVDSASRDATRKVAKRAGVEVLAIRENRGFGFAANAGIAQTSGEFVAVVKDPDLGREYLDEAAKAELVGLSDEELFSNQVLFVLRPHGRGTHP